MPQMKLWTSVMCVCALATSAAGSGTTSALRLRVLDETAPAGSVVQMKVRTYEVTPISTASVSFDPAPTFFEGIDSIGIFATTGEVAGAAMIDGTQVARIAYVTSAPLTTDEYPFLTVSLRMRPDMKVGSQAEFTLDPSSLWNVGGTVVTTRVTPGRVTVGGSVAITDVIPGEGWQAAGTVVSVRGVGFNSRSRLKVDDIGVGSVRVVSSTEIRFTLREPVNMTAQRLRVDNPDGSRSTFYSHMRGIPAATSVRTLLSETYPIFSGTARVQSTLGPIPAMNALEYSALALQNPNVTSATVTVALYAADGALLHSSTRSLKNGYRLALELSELLDGVMPSAGAFVRVTSSLPIEVFGLLCDEGTWTVTPRLPIEATS
jgi:hypothetical protein